MEPTIPTPPELEEILCERLGLTDETKDTFLKPPYILGDVFLFADMERAVGRIHKAIVEGEQIGIYTDYDCDGIPGAVVLLDFFKKVGVADRVHVYIPDRHDEGYGLSSRGIDTLATKGVTLIITVDLGITAIAEVADARSRGIDTIVTDHHQQLSEYPAAYAIVHPSKSTYSNTEPCGAGVAFYLVCACVQTYREEFEIPDGWEKWLLDLVGFATLADMVPLVGENRMLAFYGLMVMRKTKRIGLRTLLLKNGISFDALTETDLTFTVAPRLNAASRMESPILAFELLATDDLVRATAIVNRLEEINAERKTLVARLVKEAHKSLSSRELPEIVVVGNPLWRPAVLGLVATKLQEHYNKSFFVWGEGGDGLLKGSCRMIETHHAALLFQALPEGAVLHAGGHQAAGGFSVAKEEVHFLEEHLNAAIAQITQDESLESASVPISVPLATATTRHLTVVRTFAPFGVGNPQPEFLFENVEVVSVKMFGKAKEHLECAVRDATGSATAFAFFTDDEIVSRVISGATISFVGTLEAGWRGGVRVRIQNLLY